MPIETNTGFERPTTAEIIARVSGDLNSRLGTTRSLIARTNEYILARVMAGVSNTLHDAIEFAAEQIFVPFASETALYVHAAIWRVPRQAAQKSTGNLTLTGAEGSTMPLGRVFVRDDGVRFVTTAAATIAVGETTATVAVEAETAGDDGDTDAGATLTAGNPAAGIDAEADVASGGLTGGADLEALATWRSRILQRIQNPPSGGNAQDYVRWCQEAGEVDQVFVQSATPVPGEVTIYFTVDGDDPVPDAAKVTEVQTYLDDSSRKVLPVEINVETVSTLSVDINFTSISPDTATIQTAIEAELESEFRALREPDTTIRNSRIMAAIARTPGLDYFVLADVGGGGATADVVQDDDEIAVLGTLSTGGVPW